jgi:hypothetical protein
MEERFLDHEKCPSVRIIRELSMLRQFSSIDTQNPSEVTSSATIKQTNSACEYSNKTATLDVNIEFNAVLRSKGNISSNNNQLHTYPFFIAITDKSGDIIAKEVFAAPINFLDGMTTGTHTETIRQIIPITDRKDAHKYTVTIGFQLSDKELDYNRAFLKANPPTAQINAPLPQTTDNNGTSNSNAPIALTR